VSVEPQVVAAFGRAEKQRHALPNVGVVPDRHGVVGDEGKRIFGRVRLVHPRLEHDRRLVEVKPRMPRHNCRYHGTVAARKISRISKGTLYRKKPFLPALSGLTAVPLMYVHS
jgi:hypothetical protein